MTTTVTITGTGYPSPSVDRAGPGVLVQSNGIDLQFDAGRSTVQRLTAANVAMSDLDAVFLTHHHSDHLTALQDLVLTRWILDRGDIPLLDIVAPAGPCVRFLEKMMIPWEDDIAVRIPHMSRNTGPEYEIVGFDLPSEPTQVWSKGQVQVQACRVHHEPVEPAAGYRIDTPDGAIAITGDTVVCDEVAALAEGAKVLVYEAIRFAPVEDMPADRHFILDYHADTRLIGKQVKDLDIETLILTHLCPEPKTEAELQAFADDIRDGGYSGNLIVANDLDSVTL